MEALYINHSDRQEGGITEPPLMYKSHQGNPLENRHGFEPGDRIRANDASNGLVPGKEYPILGFWHRNQTHMYVYLEATENGHMASFRTAVEELTPEDLGLQEVLFYNLLPSDLITEICIQDCLKSRFRQRPNDRMQSLSLVPAKDTQVNMKRTYGGLHEKGREQDASIPLTDEKGQYSLFFNVA
ncbi:hypothetical protein [Rufibacter soli]